MKNKTNKKSLLTVMVVGLTGLMMTGCTTYSYTSRSTSVRLNTMQSENLGAEVDVDFSRKVTGSSDAQVLKIDAINEAQYKCINENNIDVIVDPIYKIEFNMFQKRAYKATVVGYAGMYKQVKTGVDAVVEKNYKVEDIEKYKLITDPTFYQYYYQKDPVQGGDVTNYYINSNSAPAPVVTKTQPSLMVQPTAVPQKIRNNMNANLSVDYKKAKQLRDAGIGIFTTGVFELGLVFPLLVCFSDYEYYNGYHYEYDYNESQMDAGWFFCALGCASIISGIPMWAVGQNRIKKANAPQLAFGGTKDGLGMRLTF